MSTAFIGKGIDRLDGRAKITGKAVYSADTPVANVAHAVLVPSSISKGTIASIDFAAAKALPGVLEVFTHLNAPRLANANKKPAQTDKVVQLLQDENVLYDGQPVALVVADTLERAEHAASLVVVTYASAATKSVLGQELGSAYTPESAGPGGSSEASRGDFDAAWAKSKVRIEATYTTQEQTHNPMELHATVAVWQGRDRVTLYDATQGIFGVKKRIAGIFGIPVDNVRVISHFLGGGFGCKGSSWSHVALATMAARELARPVKIVITRAQMFQTVGHRPATVQKVSLGASEDGKLLAVGHAVFSHTSTFDDFVEPSAKQTRMLYASDASKTSHRLVKLDIPTPTFTRAPGEASGTFALESAIDELAHACKLDPIELRLKNHADRDPDGDKPFSSKSLKECYKRGAELFGWAKRKPEPRSMRDGHWLVGMGMATATYPANQMPASALVRIDDQGKAVVLAGSQDIGTGTYTIMTQIAAETLGLEMEQVQFDLGDTNYPEASVSGGSATAASVGSVVKRACQAVQKKLAELAVADPKSPLHGMKAEDLGSEGGALVSPRDPKTRDSYADLVKRSGEKAVEARIEAKESASRKGYSLHAFGAQFAEVRVDEELGIIEVSRMVGAFGAGRILNAKTARSQLIGGMIWGMGYALLEHTERDARTARAVTRDLADYHVPVDADVRSIEVIMVDEVDEHVNEIGAKGIGEIGITGAAAAIANAIFHATGKRVRDLPITLDKLL